MTLPVPPFLAESVKGYEALVGRAQAEWATGNAERTLGAIREAAHYAWFRPPGRFADGALENLARSVGLGLERPLAADLVSTVEKRLGAVRASKKRRVLHVITRALEVGGHTKLVLSWVERDSTSEHAVLLSFQSHQPYRRDLESRVRAAGGSFLRLPAELGFRDVVMVLRRAADLDFDLVVLHSHPDDPLPTAAFARPGGAPVLLVNHADHAFWLGSSVADLVLHLRRRALQHSERRRAVRKGMLLPIPIELPSSRPGGATRLRARRELGLPADRPLLLSTGTAYKYTPTAGQDFFRSAHELLEIAPRALLLVVGVTEAELAGLTRAHPRVRALGPVADPGLHQLACDLVLEPYPFGSMTAVLEAVSRGCTPLLAPTPPCPLLISAGDALESRVERPADTATYLTRGAALSGSGAACDPSLIRSVNEHHAGPGWSAALHGAYGTAMELGHAPRDIPEMPALCDEVDLGVSCFAEAQHARKARG